MSKTAYNISLKGYVGGYDFDRSTVDKELAKNEGKQVNVLIDSLGGSLATGLSISATNQRDGSFGMPLAYTNQKLLCLQWKCGLGLEMALSVDARRGSAPCRWAFPGVLFIIKKCWNEILVILKKNNINHQNHSNNAKKQKNFQMTKHLHRDLSTTYQKNRPFGFLWFNFVD